MEKKEFNNRLKHNNLYANEHFLAKKRECNCIFREKRNSAGRKNNFQKLLQKFFSILKKK